MVNYPRGIFSSIEHSISHQNKIIFSDRGMTLEQQINESNHCQRADKFCLILPFLNL